MKTLSILSLFVFLGASVFAQTIRRVNNTPGLNDPNVYATLQAAHDAAAANDIISVEPAPGINYGDLNAFKRINIVGPGYFLDKNPNTVFDKREPVINRITFQGGSANSTVTGLNVSQIGIQDLNISVTRCLISQVSFGVSTIQSGGVFTMGNNALISRNIINSISGGTYNSTCGGAVCTLYYGTNCVISNNIIISTINLLSAAIIKYNTMQGNFQGVINSTVSNNIFEARSQLADYRVLTGGAANTGTTALNNICLSVNGLPTGNGNINGANPNIVFIGTSNPFANYLSIGDSVFQLAAGSPALTAAVGGTQAGAFGDGANAYRLSGVPNTPIVTSFISTGSGNNATPLSITLSVRSNN